MIYFVLTLLIINRENKKRIIEGKYILVNYGVPSEGSNVMYGKNSQSIGSAFDLFIQEFSMEYSIILYASHSSDISHVLSLQQIVLSMGISPSRLRAIEYVPNYFELTNLITHSQLHITFRYTAAMLSISTSTPFVGIAYRFKTIEITDAYRLNSMIVRSDDVDYPTLRSLSNKILHGRQNATLVDQNLNVYKSYHTEFLRFIHSIEPQLSSPSSSSPSPSSLTPTKNAQRIVKGLYLGEVQSNEGKYLFQTLSDTLQSLTSSTISLYQFSYFDVTDQTNTNSNNNYWGASYNSHYKYNYIYNQWSIPFEFYDFFVIGNAELPDLQFDYLLSYLLRNNRTSRIPLLLWGCTVNYSYFSLHRSHLTSLQSLSYLIFDYEYSLLSSSDRAEGDFEYRQILNDHSPSFLSEIAKNEFLSYFLYNKLMKTKFNDFNLFNNSMIFGLDSVGKLTPVLPIPPQCGGDDDITSGQTHSAADTLITNLLSIQPSNHPLPIIVFQYSPAPDPSEQNSNLLIFNKISTEDSLTKICKTIQLLSQNYTVILSTFENRHLSDLNSIWSFIRTASPRIPSVINNVILLPEVFEIGMFNRAILRHTKLFITTSNFGLSLALQNRVPFYHLTNDYFSQETIEALSLSKYSTFVDEITSSTLFYMKIAELIQNYQSIKKELQTNLSFENTRLRMAYTQLENFATMSVSNTMRK